MNENSIGWAFLGAWAVLMLFMTTPKQFKKRLLVWWLLVALFVIFMLALAYRMRQQPLVKIPPAVDTNATPLHERPYP